MPSTPDAVAERGWFCRHNRPTQGTRRSRVVSIDSSSLFPGGSRIAPVGVEIIPELSHAASESESFRKAGGANRRKGEANRPAISGNASPHPFAVVAGHTFRRVRLVLFGDGPRRTCFAGFSRCHQTAGRWPARQENRHPVPGFLKPGAAAGARGDPRA